MAQVAAAEGEKGRGTCTIAIEFSLTISLSVSVLSLTGVDQYNTSSLPLILPSYGPSFSCLSQIF